MGQSIQQYSLLSVLTVCRNEYVKTFLKLGQLGDFKVIVWGSHTQVLPGDQAGKCLRGGTNVERLFSRHREKLGRVQIRLRLGCQSCRSEDSRRGCQPAFSITIRTPLL